MMEDTTEFKPKITYRVAQMHIDPKFAASLSDPEVKRHPWKQWFAWRPVKDIHGKWHWMEYVYRKLGNTYVDHDDWSWHYYGTLFDVLKDKSK